MIIVNSIILNPQEILQNGLLDYFIQCKSSVCCFRGTCKLQKVKPGSVKQNFGRYM